MSVLLGGDRRAPLMASRRGLRLDHDVEGAAGEEASFDHAERPRPARRGKALLLTGFTGLGLAAALGAGAFGFAGKDDSTAVAGEAPAVLTLASADAIPDLSPLRAAMLARADRPSPATEERAAPEPLGASPAPTAPAKEAEGPAATPPEPVVGVVAAPTAPVPEPRPVPPSVAPSPPAVAPAPALTAAEAAVLVKRAKALIEHGDIAAARRFLERAAAAGDGAALFALAETHDPAVLDRWRVHGVRADVERARELYRQASERGIGASAARLAALR